MEAKQTYTPAHIDREMQYRTYRHESEDLRLRVAPASLDGDDHPGYTLGVTTYPGLEFSTSETVRTVLTFDRCDQFALHYMVLFLASYDGPETLEAAVEYATKRTRGYRSGRH